MSFSILEKVIYLMHELPFIIIFRFWIFYCFLFSGQNVCTNTRTIHQFADDKCSAFIDYVIDGFSLNKTKTFPGKSAQEINTLLTNPDPNLQCYFFKYVRQKRFNLCKGFVWKKKINSSKNTRNAWLQCVLEKHIYFDVVRRMNYNKLYWLSK